jgi:tRNA A37 threonylcarbamoyladenosine modification protein TsaB
VLVKKLIYIDSSTEDVIFFIKIGSKEIIKKLKLEKSENLPVIFYKFIILKKINIDETFDVIINLGPGNLIGIRNSIVLVKMLKILFGCRIIGTSYFNIFQLRKKIRGTVLYKVRNYNLLLNLRSRKVQKIATSDLKKYNKYYVKKNFLISDIENLLQNKKFIKKIVPIHISK